MLVLLGGSGSGKDTVAKELCNSFDYRKIIAYTTRPARSDEVNGVDYYFIDDDQFAYLVASDFFGEHTSFDTICGTWRYGTPRDKYGDNAVVILNPDSIRQVARLNLFFVSYEIHIDKDSRVKQLIKRGDSEAEVMRRLADDKIKFESVSELIDKHIWNDGYKMPPEYIADKIHQHYIKMKEMRR